jgi:iron complex outermembrane receptor protein
VRGRVAAEATDQPVVDAQVTLVELNRRTTTDENGIFVFADVPRGTFTLGVHAASFSSFHIQLEVPAIELAVALEPDHHFTEEVTVTAVPWAVSPLETSQSVGQVDQERIKARGNNSIGEALEHVPGVANIGTGDALGAPVIRGISENRIRIMNDGVPVNHQQWSSRHAPNIEPALAERVEVVRGPATVMWGPDAMGGVINVVHPPLPSTAKGKSEFHGEVGLGYFTNAGQGQGQVVLEGAKGGFGWWVGAVRRDAGDSETPQGSLDNTDYQQTNGTASVGYTGGWGSARFRWLHWENDVGFYFPETSPTHGRFFLTSKMSDKPSTRRRRSFPRRPWT